MQTRRTSTWTHEDDSSAGHLYYFSVSQNRSARTKEVKAVIDIDKDGNLIGVELIDDMPPPPSEGTDMRPTPITAGLAGASGFQISAKEQGRIFEWLYNTVYPLEIARQKKEIVNPTPYMLDCWRNGIPGEEAGATGITYSFTPTAYGTVIRVRYGDETKMSDMRADAYEIDVTDYESW